MGVLEHEVEKSLNSDVISSVHFLIMILMSKVVCFENRIHSHSQYHNAGLKGKNTICMRSSVCLKEINFRGD